MIEISTKKIEEAVYKLCYEANTSLNAKIYNKILEVYKNTKSDILKTVLQNAQIAYQTKRPLCQDTGQVIVFCEVGQEVHIKGGFIETAINYAIEKCYKENFFRKSVVNNAVFDRTNTCSNTPAIIYTKLVEGNEVKIKVLIKGGGSENKSLTKMLLPTMNEDEIVTAIGNMILSAGVNACPPMFIGIGIGGTLDKASVLSKEVFFKHNFSDNEFELARKIKEYVNSKAPKEFEGSYALDVKVNSIATHIACMPVAVTVNCHSDRMSECTINENGIIYNHRVPDFVDFSEENSGLREIRTNAIKKIKQLKQCEKVLLTGEIYVARDMAHKKLQEMMKTEVPLPLDIGNKIIFYAGPCPAKPNEVTGAIGPTTASRMDKYAVELYDKGLLATIGKGDRNTEVTEAIKRNGAKYFTVIGGVAALLADKVKKSEIIAFEELGAEALYRLYVEKFPVTVEIG